MIINLNKQKKTAILLFFYSISIAAALLFYQDFGIHIEEKFHRLNGHYWLNYIANIFNLDFIQNATRDIIDQIGDYTLSSITTYNKYGIVLDLPVALIEIFFGIKDVRSVYYLKHFLGFLIFLTSSFFFFKVLEERYKNFYLSFIGLFLYLSSPRILGDSFLYKDVLFLSFFMLTLYFFLQSLNNLNYKNLFLFSMFSALSFSLKIFMVILPFIFIFIIFVKNFYFKNYFNILNKILFYLFSFLIFLYVFWPYLWADPLNNFLQLFVNIKDDLVNVHIFFNGSYIYNRTLPDYYLPFWITISTPFLQTSLFILGIFFCLRRFLNRYSNIKNYTNYYDLWRGKKEEYDSIFLITLFSFFFFFIFFNAPLYNGWRLAYFFNIFFVYFAINFIYRFNTYFRKKKFKKFFFLIIFFLFTYNITAIVKTHPYQSFYFSSLITEKQKNSFEGDYHGLATKNFFEKIIKEDERELIRIGVASHTPIQRGLEVLSSENIKKFEIVGQEYKIADYIFKNNISEVNSFLINKYEIPVNFNKIYELKVDNVILYEIFKSKINQ